MGTTKTKTYLNANQINHKVNSSGQENGVMSALPFPKHSQMKPSSGSSSAPSTRTVIPNRPPTMGQPKISSQNHNSSHKASPGAKENNCLPQTRVKTIMKSSPDVETVSQESLFLITRATELFIMYMAKLASRNGGEDPSVTYGDLAAVVQRKESMEFLHDILPKKIKYGESLKMMEEEQDDDGEIF